MKFTQRNAVVASLVGAALVYAVALAVSGGPQPPVWHATILGFGAVAGLADLSFFSFIARIRGR